MAVSETTRAKYLLFLEYLCKERTFNLTLVRAKFAVSSGLLVQLKKQQLITMVKKGTYQWVGNELSIHSLVDSLVEDMQKDVIKSLAKNNKTADSTVGITNPALNIPNKEQQALNILQKTGRYTIYLTQKIKIF